MNLLDGIIANNNIMIVKQTLEKLTLKLLSQSKVNKSLVTELKGDCERLDDLYLNLNELKEDNKTLSQRNKYLESILISNVNYSRDLNNKVEDLEQQNKELKFNIEEI